MTADPTFWNKLAESYAAKPVDRPEAFERKIEITKSRMEPNHRVLDIGCGTGSLVLRLANSASELHGLDISSEMIRIARDKAQASDAGHVTFHVGPFDEATPFEDESFDGICAYSILHLLEDRQDALARIYRLLKPGGFFVSSTVTLGDSWIPYTIMLTAMRWMGRAPFVSVVRSKTLVAEIEAAGFVNVELPDVGAQDTVTFAVASKPA